jgi:hypothetical protein
MAKRSEGEVRAALVAALLDNPRQLGKVYSLDPEMNMKAKNIVELEGAANEGAVANIRCAISALLNGVIPNSPSVSNGAIGSLNGLVRDNPNFLPAVKEHLNEVFLELQDRANSKVFKEEEAEVRRHGSEEMIQLVEKRGGVYAYSLPHYLNFPCKEDPERYWYKVGFTTGNFESRILGSHRTTGLPEDPVVRRTYFSTSLDPRTMERKFHKMLKASGLQTDARYGGEEWFATTEEQLDALAELLDFEVQRPNEVDEA